MSAITLPVTATTSPSAPSTIGPARHIRAAWSDNGSLKGRSRRSWRPYLDQVRAAARSGLFDTIGHLDVVKRYLYPYVLPADLAARPELFEPVLRAMVESGTALEVNTSGLRHSVRETYPPAPIVERFRELGGRSVTAGSDAHRSDWLRLGPRRGLSDPGPGRLRRADVPARWDPVNVAIAGAVRRE